MFFSEDVTLDIAMAFNSIFKRTNINAGDKRRIKYES